MRNSTLHLFLLFLVSLVLHGIAVLGDHRTKRFLPFVRRNSAVVQMIAGVGLPVDLELQTVTMGFAFKSGFVLPMNVSDFWGTLADPFDITTHPITTLKRSIDEQRGDAHSAASATGFDYEQNEKYERHQVDAEVVESGVTNMIDMDSSTSSDISELANKFASTRWLVYKGLAEIAERNGFAGKSCVLRSICESAHTSFDYSNGVLGELFHVVMSPSATNEKITNHEDNEYLFAENIGKSGAPCDSVFRECEVSILDQFTGIYSPKSNEL